MNIALDIKDLLAENRIDKINEYLKSENTIYKTLLEKNSKIFDFIEKLLPVDKKYILDELIDINLQKDDFISFLTYEQGIEDGIKIEQLTQGVKRFKKIHPSVLLTNVNYCKLIIMQEFLTIEEIIKILKVSKMTIYRYINAGKLKAYKLGKEFRIDKKDFEEFLKNIKTK